MKEMTLHEILNMPAQELVDFFTALDIEERLTFYNSLLDRHKDFFADRIESVMGARTFAQIAAENNISAATPFEELERLSKEENNPAAQYYLSRAYLDRWNAAHPYAELPEDFVNDPPTMEAMQNDWESARRWAIECTEQNFNEGFFAQALCYDRVTYPIYYTKKLVADFNKQFSIIRYEAAVIEKYDKSIALASAARLGEIYSSRSFEDVRDIDDMRRELRRQFDYRLKVNRNEPSEEAKQRAEYALDNLRYYDERRIAIADALLQEYPEATNALQAYRAFHQRLLDELQ